MLFPYRLFHTMDLVYMCELTSPHQATLFYAGAGAFLITLLLLLIIFLSTSSQKCAQRSVGNLCKPKCFPEIGTMHLCMSLKKEESRGPTTALIIFAFP